MENLVKTEWKGYTRYDFTVNGYYGIIVEPKKAVPHRPWVWRAEFFDVFSNADMEMLAQGWHLAYYQICDMYGCPKAVELMEGFHKAVVKEFKLYNKADIFGFSRGGLYTVNFAAANPDKTSSIYLDAAVLDINTWPGGENKKVFHKEWAECMKWYGLTEETAPYFKGNPLDKIDILVENKIPAIIVAGDADQTVNFEANSAKFAKGYREKGGKIEVIVKPGCDHWPHSLEDPTPIVEFIKGVHGVK